MYVHGKCCIDLNISSTVLFINSRLTFNFDTAWWIAVVMKLYIDESLKKKTSSKILIFSDNLFGRTRIKLFCTDRVISCRIEHRYNRYNKPWRVRARARVKRYNLYTFIGTCMHMTHSCDRDNARETRQTLYCAPSLSRLGAASKMSVNIAGLSTNKALDLVEFRILGRSTINLRSLVIRRVLYAALESPDFKRRELAIRRLQMPKMFSRAIYSDSATESET